jgi:hypothetical protein
MAFSQPIANEAQVADEGLIRLLRCANASLGQLRQRAEDVVALEDAAELGFCPRQLKTLCGLLDGGRGRIQRRLSIVAGACGAGREPEPDSVAPVNAADPLAFMAEYRACCRLLCRALNEALRISNGPAGAMLSDFVLRLEKQLWLVNAPKRDPGTDPYRSVALFLAC